MSWYTVYYFEMVSGVKVRNRICITHNRKEAYEKARRAAKKLNAEVTVKREKGMQLNFDTVNPGD